MTLPGKRILDEVSRTGIELLLREPFYAHLLGSLNKEVVGPGHPVDTLAVGLGPAAYTLYVNADFWDGPLAEPAHRLGVLKHELLHLIFRHLQVQEPRLDSMLMNIAFDLVVNQYVDREQLPADSIFLESFPDLRLLPGQTWFYYYKKMEDLRQGASGEFKGTPSSDMLQKIRSDSNGLERHQPWRELRSRTELEQAVADNHLDSLLRTAQQRTNAHAWGSLPGEVREFIQQRLHPAPPALDWRRALRLFAGNASRTRLYNTIKRPSKRYGVTPGIKLRRERKLLVAIDTSGSLGTGEIEQFFQEIFHLWRAGAEVEILECDVKIARRYPYRGRMPELVEGRGGTSFDEPLEVANRERPDGLIYFTDGFAAPPKIAMRVPVLWVLTAKGLDSGHPTYRSLPGRKTRL